MADGWEVANQLWAEEQARRGRQWQQGAAKATQYIPFDTLGKLSGAAQALMGLAGAKDALNRWVSEPVSHKIVRLVDPSAHIPQRPEEIPGGPVMQWLTRSASEATAPAGLAMAIPFAKWLRFGSEVPPDHPRPYRGWMLSDGKIISIGEKWEDGYAHSGGAPLLDHFEVENAVTQRPGQQGYVRPSVRFAEESVARLGKVAPDEVGVEFFGPNISEQQLQMLKQMLDARPNARFTWEIREPAAEDTVAWGSDLRSLYQAIEARRSGVPPRSR